MLLILGINILLAGSSLAQRTPYSLQTAVDSLNRQEMMQYPYRERYNPYAEQDQDIWSEGQFFNGHYDPNVDNNIRSYATPKRSTFFRERESKYDSPIRTVFREHEPLNHEKLTDQFLKEIEESKQFNREGQYKEALRRLWEKYQQQENEVEEDLFDNQKHFGSFLMQKKRSYPVLPSVSSRKKRFPTKRSSPVETNEKVPQDLKELFGKGSEGNLENKDANITAKNSTAMPTDADHSDDDQNDESNQEFENQATENDATKRTESKLESVLQNQMTIDDLRNKNSREKKSIEWSKYFGIDRKKKSVSVDENKSDVDVRKRTPGSESSSSSPNDVDDEKHKKEDLDTQKLENMDRKLQSMENLIIDETIKYTGAHEGIIDPDEIRRLKNHVVSRLATAYTLEKMRRALEKLRLSIDKEKHLRYNVIDDENDWDEDSLKKKLSTKKEEAQFENGYPSTISPNIEKSNEVAVSEATIDHKNEKAFQSKKRTGYFRYHNVPNNVNGYEEEFDDSQFETLNDAYLGKKKECPLIESINERCRRFDIPNLQQTCGAHQICYLCGVSQVACDFQYLAEADEICGRNNECQTAARSVLMLLRGAPSDWPLGPKECLRNPCLYATLREIGL